MSSIVSLAYRESDTRRTRNHLTHSIGGIERHHYNAPVSWYTQYSWWGGGTLQFNRVCAHCNYDLLDDDRLIIQLSPTENSFSFSFLVQIFNKHS